MVFYNGFNLLVDLVIIALVFVGAHGIGYRKGISKASAIAKVMRNHPAGKGR